MFAVIAGLLLVLELAYFFIADKCNIIDKPNLRGSSTSVTLRGGGVIFPLGVLIYCSFFGMDSPWFVLALLLIAGVSFWDDVRPVPNKIRFAVHVMAMLMMFWQWDILNVDSWWMILVALVFCTGVINAFNFMDGINGITAGYGLAVLAPLAWLNGELAFVDQNLIWVFGISLLIFCVFNFRKRAKCFAGDVGSVAVAFILIYITGRLILRTGDLWWLMIMSLYGVDTGCTILHRIMLRENLGQAHRKHMFQLLANELKVPHVAVSLMYMLVQLCISAGLVWAPVNKWLYSGVVLLVLAVVYVLFKRKFFHLHVEHLASMRSDTLAADLRDATSRCDTKAILALAARVNPEDLKTDKELEEAYRMAIMHVSE